MDAYIFAADCWCEKCGEKIREDLKFQGKAPKNPKDEYTYDSDYYPKGPYEDAGGASDTIHHCAAGDKCIDPTTLPSGRKVGKFLENPLTRHGVEYLKEKMEEDPDSEVVRFWASHYRKHYNI